MPVALPAVQPPFADDGFGPDPHGIADSHVAAAARAAFDRVSDRTGRYEPNHLDRESRISRKHVLPQDGQIRRAGALRCEYQVSRPDRHPAGRGDSERSRYNLHPVTARRSV